MLGNITKITEKQRGEICLNKCQNSFFCSDRTTWYWDFPGGPEVKRLPSNAGDGLDPWSAFRTPPALRQLRLCAAAVSPWDRARQVGRLKLQLRPRAAGGNKGCSRGHGRRWPEVWDAECHVWLRLVLDNLASFPKPFLPGKIEVKTMQASKGPRLWKRLICDPGICDKGTQGRRWRWNY